MLSKSPLKKTRYKHFKDVAQARFCHMNLPIGRCFPSDLTDVKLLILAQFCSLYERLLNKVENPHNSSKLGLHRFVPPFLLTESIQGQKNSS